MVDVHRNSLPAGPSSTVDADTVDGLHAAAFNQIPGGWSALPSGVDVSDVPDSWPTDSLTVYVVNAAALQGVSEAGLLLHLGRNSRRVQYFFVDGARSVRVRQSQAGASSWDAWSLVCDAGHDGTGSGIDADLLDGNEASAFVLASAYTAADVLTKLKTVDGPGTGLDADLLDGNEASAFVLGSAYTAADVLAKLKTVDGTGSGVDADLLDGAERTSFYELGGSSVWGTAWAISSTGALCVRLTNQTGRTTLIGEAVTLSSAADDSFTVSNSNLIGITAEAAANGAPCWIAISGVTPVLLRNAESVSRNAVLVPSSTAGRWVAGSYAHELARLVTLRAAVGGTDVSVLAYIIQLHWG